MRARMRFEPGAVGELGVGVDEACEPTTGDASFAHALANTSTTPSPALSRMCVRLPVRARGDMRVIRLPLHIHRLRQSSSRVTLQPALGPAEGVVRRKFIPGGGDLRMIA